LQIKKGCNYLILQLIAINFDWQFNVLGVWGPGLSFKRPPLAEPMQQPTKNSTNGKAAAAAPWLRSARWRRQLGRGRGTKINNQLKARKQRG
jgi:hypothetical protein